MQKTSSLLFSCFVALAAVLGFSASDANAAGRSTIGTGNADVGRAGVNTQRMPTMPTMSINTIGTIVSAGVGNNVTPGTPPTPPTPPTPDPDPDPDPDPTPSDCPDGGVRNSDFTVEMCMQSILDCVQSGVLPNGLNDLFNEDLRNSIINGMGICATQVDRCIREVRVDCHPVYDSFTDVWLDFNSRIVQPEYYNFVLRKTGLTPNQAENVCALLDRNTYGRSFAAVSGNADVTWEYSNKVGAYNEQRNGSLSKANPQGATVNTTANGNNGVDGERGHYARWDATNAVCKLRVAAYNKDELITNKWLFGALGDNKSAEVWRDAGSTFTCNKDLFDFSLLNDTSTAAVVGMGGGTALGAGIGALTGHGAREFECSNVSARAALAKQIDAKMAQKLNLYLDADNHVSAVTLDETQCKAIQDLYDAYVKMTQVKDLCVGNVMSCTLRIKGTNNPYVFKTCDELRELKVDGGVLTGLSKDAQEALGLEKDGLSLEGDNPELVRCINYCEQNRNATRVDVPCTFSTFKGGVAVSRLAGSYSGLSDKLLCTGLTETCRSQSQISGELRDLDSIFAKLTALQGEKSTVGKNALIGAGVGLATGGVATAITAFVERNNISCRVGDGLNTVGFGKSFTIDSLKDFYVKWNLHVEDSISPTARVTSCQDWIDTCGMYKTAADCKAVEINYQKPGRNTTTLIRSACKMSGSVCIENRSVAVSYGVCSRNGTIKPPYKPVTPGARVDDPRPDVDIDTDVTH